MGSYGILVSYCRHSTQGEHLTRWPGWGLALQQASGGMACPRLPP